MKKKILSAVLACAATMTFATGAFAEEVAPGASDEEGIVITAELSVTTEGIGGKELNDKLLVAEDGTRYSWSDVDAVAFIGDGSFEVCFAADQAKAGTDVVVIGETELPDGYGDGVVVVDLDMSGLGDLIGGNNSDAPAGDEGDDADAPADDAAPAEEVDAPAAVLAPVTTAENGEIPDQINICMVGFESKTIELFDSSLSDGGELKIAAKEGTVNIQAVVQIKESAGAGAEQPPQGGSTTTNPGTGIALAVAPAGLAVAFVSVAAVMSKKKK